MGLTRFNTCLVVLLGIGVFLLPGSAACSQTMQQRLDDLIEIEDAGAGHLSSRERAARIGAAFDQRFGMIRADSLRDLDLAELQSYFRAAEIAQFYSHRGNHLATMELALAELVRREQATPEDLQGMFGAYLSMRAFGQARELARTHDLPLSDALPEVVDQRPPGFRGASLLQLTPGESAVARVPFEASSGNYIVAISHPMCRFTRNAIAAIEADTELTKIFRDNAHWIAPVDRRLHRDVLHAWNKAHPLTPFAIAYRRDDWPELDHWATPTFYFFAQGKLVAKITGWPDEGRREDLIAAAKKAGLN